MILCEGAALRTLEIVLSTAAATWMLAVRRLRPLVARVQQRRSLGSWSSDFESARGASVETRQALGRKLRDVWVLEQDAAESEAMQAEAGGTQLTFVLSVEGTAVALLQRGLYRYGIGKKFKEDILQSLFAS